MAASTVASNPNTPESMAISRSVTRNLSTCACMVLMPITGRPASACCTARRSDAPISTGSWMVAHIDRNGRDRIVLHERHVDEARRGLLQPGALVVLHHAHDFDVRDAPAPAKPKCLPSGFWFAEEDRAAAFVGMPEQAAARVFFGNQESAGRHFGFWRAPGHRGHRNRGGSGVRDDKSAGLKQAAPRFVYVPFMQNDTGHGHYGLCAHLHDPVEMARRCAGPCSKPTPACR